MKEEIKFQSFCPLVHVENGGHRRTNVEREQRRKRTTTKKQGWNLFPRIKGDG